MGPAEEVPPSLIPQHFKAEWLPHRPFPLLNLNPLSSRSNNNHPQVLISLRSNNLGTSNRNPKSTCTSSSSFSNNRPYRTRSSFSNNRHSRILCSFSNRHRFNNHRRSRTRCNFSNNRSNSKCQALTTNIWHTINSTSSNRLKASSSLILSKSNNTLNIITNNNSSSSKSRLSLSRDKMLQLSNKVTTTTVINNRLEPEDKCKGTTIRPVTTTRSIPTSLNKKTLVLGKFSKSSSSSNSRNKFKIIIKNIKQKPRVQSRKLKKLYLLHILPHNQAEAAFRIFRNRTTTNNKACRLLHCHNRLPRPPSPETRPGRLRYLHLRQPRTWHRLQPRTWHRLQPRTWHRLQSRTWHRFQPKLVMGKNPLRRLPRLCQLPRPPTWQLADSATRRTSSSTTPSSP